jgi:nicotinamide phosphoribosyltransferase
MTFETQMLEDRRTARSLYDQSIIGKSDSYKGSQWAQYAPGMKSLYSYLEARQGAKYPFVSMVGLQQMLKEHFVGQVFTLADIEFFEAFFNLHVAGGVFHKEGWTAMYNKYGGRLPVEIKAVPEGTSVDVSNALITMQETDEEFAWLTNYLETLLVQVWYPITVATIAKANKDTLRRYLKATSDLTGDELEGTLSFMLHDFGFRGVSSVATAAIGDLAHLAHFRGSDTIAGPLAAYEFYGMDFINNPTLMPAYNIIASEHSTITSWGREREIDAYRNMLHRFPNNMVSVVSDSYDIYHATQHIWGGGLRDEVLKRKAANRLVIRPDSGDPRHVLPRLLDILWDKFPGHVNAKGYKVLFEGVRIIQGDGIDPDSLPLICEAVKAAGYSLENMVFGSGGGLLQKMDRDTQRFAFKASYTENQFAPDGMDVYKDPVTANRGKSTKASKRGKLKLIHSAVPGHFVTVSPHQFPDQDDLLRPVFRNGELLVDDTLTTIRERTLS